MKNNFYVYVLRRPDKIDPFNERKGQPFYVGKGTGKRIKMHRPEAKRLKQQSGFKAFKICLINSLWDKGIDFKEDKIFKNLSEQQAFEIEKNLIALYGRKDNDTGILTNHTDGGEGAAGCRATEESRKKMSRARRGGTLALEHREKIRAAHLGIKKGPLSEEAKQKISKAQKGRPKSEEFRRKISEVQRGRKHSEEHCHKSGLVHRGKTISEEQRRKISEANKGKALSEDHRRKIGEANSRRIVSEETRKKMGEATRKRGPRSEETKLKISEGNRGRKAWNKGLRYQHNEEV